MFADGVMESSTTLGTADYTVTGAVYSGRTFGAVFNDGDQVCFVAQTLTRSKFEIILGSYEIGPPKKLLRTTVLLSSQGGAKVNWQAGDVYYIASFSSATVLAGFVKGNLSVGRPWWVQFGRWVREDFPSAGLHTEYFFDGTNDINLGVVNESTHAYARAGINAALDAFLATPSSANLRAAITDETGTGPAVFGDGPTINNPNLTGTVQVPNKTQGANDVYAVNSAYVDRVAVQQIVTVKDSGWRTLASVSIPYDDSIPGTTTGDEYTQIKVTITPKRGTSRLIIRGKVMATRTGADTITIALFKDAVTGALASNPVYVSGGNVPVSLAIDHEMVSPAAGVAIDFKIRIGSHTANPIYINGTSSGRVMGGTMDSFLQVIEYGA